MSSAPPSPLNEFESRRALVLVLFLGIQLLGGANTARSQDAGQPIFPSLGVSDKIQSKLWHHDGSWWGAFNGTDRIGIYELVDSTQTWTEVDSVSAPVTPFLKGGTNDVFWDGDNVYIARFDSVTAALYKFTYVDSTRRYFRDGAFPVSIPMGPLAESISITKDSESRLWVGVVIGLDVVMRHSSVPDTISTAPIAPPGSLLTTSSKLDTTSGFWAAADTLGNFLDADDICNIHAWAGKVGVMWSNQADDAYYFRYRNDSDPLGASSWSPVETVLEGVGLVDDHISVTNDATGRLFVGLKSNVDRILVARRNLDGSWDANTDVLYGRSGTRPIVLVDDSENKVYCFYTRWPDNTHLGENWIEYRVADASTLVFGVETIFIKQAGISMNNFQCTVQPLAPGAIAGICDDDAGMAYWNGWGPVSGIGGSGGGGPLPMPPGPPGIASGAVLTAPGASKGAAAYTFDEASGDSLLDCSGNQHHGELGDLGPGDSAQPEWTSGIAGTGLLFNGLNDYVQIPAAAGLSFTTSFTIECWARLLGDQDKMGLINKGGSLDRNYRLMVGKGGTVEFAFRASNGLDYEAIDYAGIQDAQWHHIAAVWDSDAAQQRLYVDGVLRVSSAAPVGPTTSSDPLLLGARKTSIIKDYLHGAMDQVRLSNAVLYDSNFGPPVTFSEDPVSYVSLSWSPPVDAQGGVAGYNVSRSINGSNWERLNGFVPVTHPSYTDPTVHDGMVAYRTTAIDLLGQEGPVSSVYAMPFQSFYPLAPSVPEAWSATQQSAGSGGIVAGYAMDENSGQSVADASGNQFDGYLGTTPATDSGDPLWMPGILGSALQFDGTNDCVTIPDDPSLRFAGNFTVQAWFQTAQATFGNMAICSKGTSSLRNFRLRLESNGAIEFTFASTANGTRTVTSGSNIIHDTNWHHVAAVYDKDAGEMRLYIDGVLEASTSETHIPSTSTHDILIGVRSSNSALKDWFAGRIDQVSFSGSALYAADFTPPTQFGGAGGGSTVTLNWSLPQIGLVSGYNVYRQSEGALLWKLNYDGPVLTTSFQDATPHLGSNCYYVVAVTPQGLEGTASDTTCFDIGAGQLSTDSPELPSLRALNLRVAPNPFNPSTRVYFNLPGESDVSFALYDVAGRQVRQWTLAKQSAGRHAIPLNLSQDKRVASGIYFLRVETAFETDHRRVVLIK